MVSSQASKALGTPQLAWAGLTDLRLPSLPFSTHLDVACPGIPALRGLLTMLGLLPPRSSSWCPLSHIIYKGVQDLPASAKLPSLSSCLSSQNTGSFFSKSSYRRLSACLSLDALATVLTKESPCRWKGTQAGLPRSPPDSGTGLGLSSPPAQVGLGIPPTSRAEADYLTSPVNHVGPESPPPASMVP